MLAATAQAGPEADAWIGGGDVQLWGAAATGAGRARGARVTSGSPGHETAAPVAAAPAVVGARRRGRPGGRLLRRRRVVLRRPDPVGRPGGRTRHGAARLHRCAGGGGVSRAGP